MASSKRFVPGLVRLDDRTLPSATITQIGGTLIVRGTAADEIVAVTDNGSAGPGNVTVEADDITFTATSPVRRIRVLTGGGYDDVSYTLTNDLAAGATRSVYVVLGQGDDFFAADIEAGLLGGARLDMTVLAGAGDDTLGLVGGLVDVAADAQLNLDLRGNGGLDSISVVLAGFISGRVELALYGGYGDDAIDADVTADDGSTGSVYAQVHTGAGADWASLYLDGGRKPVGVLFAGPGDDIDTTDNVVIA
jgi:hypothetical protein